MIKGIILSTHLFCFAAYSFGQAEQSNILFIIDSIPLVDDPTPDNDITDSDVSDFTIIKNRDSLKLLGYQRFDGVTYIFTKEYRNRAKEIKLIPSSGQMEMKTGVWYFRDLHYSGLFIDYYYSGRKQAEGTFKNGKLQGLRRTFFQNGNISTEKYYSSGIENGLAKEFFEDGSLKLKGEFKSGKEEGVWELYFPNGQVRQRSTFIDGTMDGKTTIYYSTGITLAEEISINGKPTPDKRLEKINHAINKGHTSSREGDDRSAIRYYSKAIELDSTFAEAYYSRGTVKINEFKFEDAIFDFNKALQLEPYNEGALANRALARIRMHQFGKNRQLSKSNGVSVLGSKDNLSIPESDLLLICSDLKQAMFLGDKRKMIIEAYLEFCGTGNIR